MKKLISILLSCMMAISLFGCAKKDPTYQLKKNVTLTLEDVLKVTNEDQNTIYYYYLMTVDNQSKKTYDLSTLSYQITDEKEEDINAIDQDTSIPIEKLKAGQSGYIAGYVGFPNNNQKDIGLYFAKDDEFMSFSNIDYREASNKNVSDKQVGMKQTLYEDDDIKIGYDYSEMTINFVGGNTVVQGFKISYENKTKNKIVVPFVTPYGTLNGLLTTDYPSKTDYSAADINTIKSLTFDGEEIYLKDISGTSVGYALLYLDGEQSLDCSIAITFNNSMIYYQGGSDEPITVEMICAALGVDRTVTLPKNFEQQQAVNEDLKENKDESTEEATE